MPAAATIDHAARGRGGEAAVEDLVVGAGEADVDEADVLGGEPVEGAHDVVDPCGRRGAGHRADDRRVVELDAGQPTGAGEELGHGGAVRDRRGRRR